jgi:hypothetical protein
MVTFSTDQENKMQLFKITCPQCPHYDSCSQKTRMFVNYCGSRLQNVQSNVRAAISECRAKHGYMLQSVIFPPAPAPNLTIDNLKAASISV